MKRILLYGAGNIAQYLLEHYIEKDSVTGIILTNKEYDEWDSIPVFAAEELADIDFDELWLANSDIATLHTAFTMGIAKEKLVLCNRVMCDEYCKENKGLLDIRYHKNISEEYEMAMALSKKRMITTTMERPPFVPYFYKNDSGKDCHNDYVRFATAALLIEEIKKRKTGGALAELGVYKGQFSAFVNSAFSDRKLYLFDTFEGFDKTDVDIEISSHYTSEKYAFCGRFSDTSVEMVLGEMRYPENCVVCQGYFPKTIPDEDIQYAFVSINCDLYQPVLEGIKYFYPRLVTGGYIMLHDYNNSDRWYGIKKAIEEYEKENGNICRVPIPDRAGSLILTK